MARKKMGEILIDNDVISRDTLNKALLKQKGTDKPIGKILEDMKVIPEDEIAKVISKQFGFPFVKGFSRHRFPKKVLNIIDAEFALTHLVFPLKIDNTTLYLAMSNPLDMALQSDLSFKLALRVSPCVATPNDIKTAIKKHYLVEIPIETDENSKTILLVDNQEITLNSMSAALEYEGYSIYKAKNGAEGLKIATQLNPHLIITNTVMPRMDGIEMFKALQTNGEIDNTPVIAASSKATAEEEYRILDLGFFDFITKPINPTRFLARVKRALRYYEDK